MTNFAAAIEILRGRLSMSKCQSILDAAEIKAALRVLEAAGRVDKKERRKVLEHRRDLRGWLGQWVRVLKQSGAYIWDERDSKAHREIQEICHRKYIAAHPGCRYAWGRIQTLLRKGAISRPMVCPKCGEKRIINGHHYDYSKPEEITWLCHRCHKDNHMEMRGSI